MVLATETKKQKPSSRKQKRMFAYWRRRAAITDTTAIDERKYIERSIT